MLLIENKIISELPVVYQELVRAKLTTPIKSIPDYDMEEQLKNVILVSYAEMGLTNSVDGKVTTFLRETLLKDFRKPKFELLTIEQIKLFISKGLRGEYGTFNGQLNTINIQNIHYWVKSGLASKDQELAMKEFNRLLDLQNKTSEVPVHIKLERSKNGLKMLFIRYKEAGKMDMLAFAYYDILCELIGVEYKGVKTLITDYQTRVKVMAECKGELERKYKAEKVRAEKRGDLNEAGLIGELLSRLDGEGELHRMVKERFLKIYFDQLIGENKELEL